MKTKHTPGEWKVVHEFNVESEEGFVATCGGQRGLMDPEKQTEMNNANARLISAAPDMLAALKDVLNRVEASDEWWMSCADKGGIDTEIIEEAIAKAEGKL